MSDSTYMTIRCRKADVARFKAVGFCVDEDNHDGTCEMVDDDRNYGNTDDLPRDIPYHGHHDGGIDYGCGIFACDGQQFVEADSLHDGTSPVVRLYQDGSLDPDDAKRANEYWDVYNKVSAVMEPGP